jgi:uncharacterized membrane protein YgcG
MRTSLLTIFAIAAFLVPAAVLAQSDETVREFRVTATLDENRLLTVTERITYDFGTNERHGIYRDIPVRYERSGGAYDLRINLKEVTMDGRPVPHSIQLRSPRFRVRIGDPDATVTGAHEYAITYSTDRAINFFGGEGELYWNVTGNEWDVPILKSSFSIVGPPSFDANAAKTACYTGAYGSTEQTCQTLTQANTVQFTAGRSFAPREGLTAVVRFQAGVISPLTIIERIVQMVRDNWILFLPFAMFIVMFFLWRAKGRDPKGRGTVVPQYEPPRGLSPMEMLGLKDQYLGHASVTAVILDLARRGYLKIDFGEERGMLGRKKQTYAFIRRKGEDEVLRPFEHTLFHGMFSGKERVELEDLKGTFHRHIVRAKEQAFAELRKARLFGKNPATVRAAYIVIAIIAFSCSFWLVPLLGLGAMGVACIIASAAIILVFGWFMPSKTKEGAVALEEVMGFKWFLSVTEKDRLAFHNAPEVKPEKFHEFLPYAVAFGVEEQWAKQFQGMDVPPPDYATGMTTWNALYFASAMHALDARAASAAYAAPSSAGAGGSGFSGGGSGGGFGGGGGGSW